MKGMEITNFPKQGYEPLVDFSEWRVAVLAFCEDVQVENIRSMQKHDLTDEVFVLVSGRGTLFLAGNGERPGKIEAQVLEKGKVYNVKKGFWHNHILDEQGIVLIVENRNTCDDNSPICLLTEEELEHFQKEYCGY